MEQQRILSESIVDNQPATSPMKEDPDTITTPPPSPLKEDLPSLTNNNHNQTNTTLLQIPTTANPQKNPQAMHKDHSPFQLR